MTVDDKTSFHALSLLVATCHQKHSIRHTIKPYIGADSVIHTLSGRLCIGKRGFTTPKETRRFFFHVLSTDRDGVGGLADWRASLSRNADPNPPVRNLPRNHICFGLREPVLTHFRRHIENSSEHSRHNPHKLAIADWQASHRS